MPGLTLCSGALRGPAANRTAAHWDELGLPQLVFGEAKLPPSPLRQLIPEVFTTSGDQPCLHDVLRHAGERTSGDAVLLVDRDLRPTPAMITALKALLSLPGRPRLAHGRAWCLPMAADPRLTDQPIEHTIRAAAARLDPPERPAWVLLPRRSLLAAPAELSSALPEATIWLSEQARRAGWQVLEATPACPCLRLSSDEAQQLLQEGPRPHADAVVEPEHRGKPRLSLLVAAPEKTFDSWTAELLPAPKLPWELVLRPDDDPDQPGSTLAAWASGLEVARGSILWPLTGRIPPQALLPVLLAFFDQPWVDVALIGSSRAGQILPASAARQGLPGTVALRREWLERSGAFGRGEETTQALRQLISTAERQGSCCAELPLTLPL